MKVEKKYAPIGVSVSNPTLENQSVSLFSNFDPDNRNCDIKTNDSNLQYDYTRRMLASDNYEVCLLRIQSTNTAVFDNYINVVCNGLSGGSWSKPIYPLAFLSPYQFQMGIVYIPCTIKLNGKTQLDAMIRPKTKVIFDFFHGELDSKSERLN